jgi:hypothetical protein
MVKTILTVKPKFSFILISIKTMSKFEVIHLNSMDNNSVAIDVMNTTKGILRLAYECRKFGKQKLPKVALNKDC